MNGNLANAKAIIAHLPPSLNETDEQFLALAEAQVQATIAIAEALEAIAVALTPSAPSTPQPNPEAPHD